MILFTSAPALTPPIISAWTTNNVSTDIQQRITLVNRSFYRLKRLSTSMAHSRRAKLTLYKILFIAVLTCGAEACIMTAAYRKSRGIDNANSPPNQARFCLDSCTLFAQFVSRSSGHWTFIFSQCMLYPAPFMYFNDHINLLHIRHFQQIHIRYT